MIRREGRGRGQEGEGERGGLGRHDGVGGRGVGRKEWEPRENGKEASLLHEDNYNGAAMKAASGA